MNALALNPIEIAARSNALGAYLAETRYELVRMIRNPNVAIPVLVLPMALYALFALLIAGEAERDALLEQALKQERLVCDPYFFDVRLEGNAIDPISTRERIRADGAGHVRRASVCRCDGCGGGGRSRVGPPGRPGGVGDDCADTTRADPGWTAVAPADRQPHGDDRDALG